MYVPEENSDSFYLKMDKNFVILCPKCKENFLCEFPYILCKKYYCLNRKCDSYKSIVLIRKRKYLFLPSINQQFIQEKVPDSYFCIHCGLFSYKSNRKFAYCQIFNFLKPCEFK